MQIKGFGHNLTALYKECRKLKIPIDEGILVGQWAAHKQEIHLTDDHDIISEGERVALISTLRRSREVWRHVWLLGKLHDAPYVLRYHRSGYYKYPDIEFLLMSLLRLNKAIEPACMASYNEVKNTV